MKMKRGALRTVCTVHAVRRREGAPFPPHAQRVNLEAATWLSSRDRDTTRKRRRGLPQTLAAFECSLRASRSKGNWAR